MVPLATSDVAHAAVVVTVRYSSIMDVLRHSPYDVTQIDSMADGGSTI